MPEIHVLADADCDVVGAATETASPDSIAANEVLSTSLRVAGQRLLPPCCCGCIGGGVDIDMDVHAWHDLAAAMSTTAATTTTRGRRRARPATTMMIACWSPSPRR